MPPGGETRHYAQYCSLARALDVVGERWTLLVIRELLAGPKRFRDLEESLRGMGPNLLASRLRTLAARGVVERVVAPRAANVSVYRLTARGRGLEDAVVALTRWGIPELGVHRQGEVVRAEWLVIVLKARFERRAAMKVDDTYEFRVRSGAEEDVVHARVRRGTITTENGPAHQPDVTLSMDIETYVAIAGGQLTPARAAAEVSVSGDREGLSRCLAIFGLVAARS